LTGGKHSQLAIACDLKARDDGTIDASYMVVKGLGVRGDEGHRYVLRAYITERSRAGDWSRPTLIFSHRIWERPPYPSPSIRGSCPLIALDTGGALDVVWDEYSYAARDPSQPDSRLVRESPFTILRIHKTRAGRWSAKQRWIENARVGGFLGNERGDSTLLFVKSPNHKNIQAAVARVAGHAWRREQLFGKYGMPYEQNARYYGMDAAGQSLVIWSTNHGPDQHGMHMREWHDGAWSPLIQGPDGGSQCGFDQQNSLIASGPNDEIGVISTCRIQGDEYGIAMRAALRTGAGDWLVSDVADKQIDGQPGSRPLVPVAVGFDGQGGLRAQWFLGSDELRELWLPSGGTGFVGPSTVATGAMPTVGQWDLGFIDGCPPSSADAGAFAMLSGSLADGPNEGDLVAVVSGIKGPTSSRLGAVSFRGHWFDYRAREPVMVRTAGSCGVMWTSDSAAGAVIATSPLAP
jgi:hypothetical protein